MARLTDNVGKLLGGIEMPVARMLAPLPKRAVAASATAAAASTVEYALNEVVFALQCYYDLPNSSDHSAPLNLKPPQNAHRPIQRCPALIEEPEERYHCTHCQGFYCHVHAEPLAHACAVHAQ